MAETTDVVLYLVSAAEEPAYETQIDPDDDMEIDDPDYDDIPG